jgi:hypothetical protein
MKTLIPTTSLTNFCIQAAFAVKFPSIKIIPTTETEVKSKYIPTNQKTCQVMMK